MIYVTINEHKGSSSNIHKVGRLHIDPTTICVDIKPLIMSRLSTQ